MKLTFSIMLLLIPLTVNTAYSESQSSSNSELPWHRRPPLPSESCSNQSIRDNWGAVSEAICNLDHEHSKAVDFVCVVRRKKDRSFVEIETSYKPEPRYTLGYISRQLGDGMPWGYSCKVLDENFETNAIVRCCNPEE